MFMHTLRRQMHQFSPKKKADVFLSRKCIEKYHVGIVLTMFYS